MPMIAITTSNSTSVNPMEGLRARYRITISSSPTAAGTQTRLTALSHAPRGNQQAHQRRDRRTRFRHGLGSHAAAGTGHVPVPISPISIVAGFDAAAVVAVCRQASSNLTECLSVDNVVGGVHVLVLVIVASDRDNVGCQEIQGRVVEPDRAALIGELNEEQTFPHVSRSRRGHGIDGVLNPL